MPDDKNEIDDLFSKIVKSGLVATSSYLIETATEQKNPRLTLDLAYSVLLVYNRLDKELVNVTRLN